MAPDSEKNPYWYVVADESEAIIYDASARRGPLHRRWSLSNHSAREKTEQLISDRGGRSFDSHGEGRHTLEKENVDAKRHASLRFAKAVVEQLVAAREQGECREFSLIAAPRFLGMLRKEASVAKLGDPFLSIDKNVVTKPVEHIERLVAESRA